MRAILKNFIANIVRFLTKEYSVVRGYRIDFFACLQYNLLVYDCPDFGAKYMEVKNEKSF